MSADISETAGCPLCTTGNSEHVVWRDDEWRITRVSDAEHPAYYRVIVNRHIVELTDLDTASRSRCLNLICGVEDAVRRELSPTKVNLASLGNYVPHLHWHVIARFDWDPRFPDAIWSPRLREVDQSKVMAIGAALGRVDDTIVKAFSASR